MKFRVLFVLSLLLLSLTALAQDEAPDPLVGNYTYSGSYGDETYEGHQVIIGSTPFYTVNFVDETSSGDVFDETRTALAQGNNLVFPLGSAECESGILRRQSDGNLFGTWIDTETAAAAPLGVEFYTPQEGTTGVAGTYDLVGSYATGEGYRATVEITENAGGWLDIVWTYNSDELFPDDTPYVETGIGMVSGNTIGYAFVDPEEFPDADCGVFVAIFNDDGSYEGVWVDLDEEGFITGTESGARQDTDG